MPVLRFGSSQNFPFKKLFSSKWVIGGIAALVITALGGTFAANIALNSNSPVEFGQGVAQTTSCDHDFTITPLSQFVNGAPGSFKVSGFRVLGLDSSDGACAGKTLSINLYGESGDSLATYVLLDSGTEFSSGDGTISNSSFTDASNSSGTLTLQTLVIDATSVFRVTVESGQSAGRLYGIRSNGRIYRLGVTSSDSNIYLGYLHDSSDTAHPSSNINNTVETGYISAIAYNPLDQFTYLLFGLCCEKHQLWKFRLPSSDNSGVPISATRIGVIDSANNDGLNWQIYGFKAMAINSNGQLWIFAHHRDGGMYAHVLQVSTSDASIVADHDLNVDTSDTSHGIYTLSNKHGYAIAFDRSNQMWVAATDGGQRDHVNFWTVNSGPQIWRGSTTLQYDGSGNLSVDLLGRFWIMDWYCKLYTFNPNQSPAEFSNQLVRDTQGGIVAMTWTP